MTTLMLVSRSIPQGLQERASLARLWMYVLSTIRLLLSLFISYSPTLMLVSVSFACLYLYVLCSIRLLLNLVLSYTTTLLLFFSRSILSLYVLSIIRLLLNLVPSYSTALMLVSVPLAGLLLCFVYSQVIVHPEIAARKICLLLVSNCICCVPPGDRSSRDRCQEEDQEEHKEAGGKETTSGNPAANQKICNDQKTKTSQVGGNAAMMAYIA